MGRVAGTARPAGLEAHALYPSLLRPVLWGGAEPPVVILEVITALALVFVAGLHVATVALAVFYLTAVHGVFAWVASQDPQMTELYVRSLAARDFYGAQPGVGTRVPVARAAIPRAS